LAGSTTKKAVIRRYEKEALTGYVNPGSYLQPGGVELLSVDGAILRVPYVDIRFIAFVRDFDHTEEDQRQVFHTRPKMEGLWIRFQFRDGEVMEGVMPNNLLQLETYGFTAIPPDPYSPSQRVFIPRVALRTVEVLGVIGSPLKRKRKAAPDQIGLFDES
jgi:hypothetical protein